jgi:transposase
MEAGMPTDPGKQQKQRALRQQGTLNLYPHKVRHVLFQNHPFFDPDDLLQVKYEMLRMVQVENRSVSEAARVFGFSRPSFYQARAAFEQGGLAGLIRHKPGPRGAHKLTPAVLEFLSQARLTQPLLRATHLAALVKKHFGVQVHPRSIERQFVRPKKPL